MEINTLISSYAVWRKFKNQTSVLILTEKEKIISEFIIGSIDGSGYLSRSIDEMIDDIAFTQNEIVSSNDMKKVLDMIQSLEPAGITSRNLQECLSLQLRRKSKTDEILIVKNYWWRFWIVFKTFKKCGKIWCWWIFTPKSLNEIEKLNPKPGGSISSFTGNNHIVPDFILSVNENQISQFEWKMLQTFMFQEITLKCWKDTKVQKWNLRPKKKLFNL